MIEILSENEFSQGEMKMIDLTKSRNLHSRAVEIIPNGTNTNAKRVDLFLGPEFYPAYIEKAQGAYVWDLDGNKYIDYVASLAPINIGYNHPRIKQRILKQLEKGSIFPMPSANEVELSELLVEKIPSAEMVKLMKTGAEVTSAAIRAARYFTGKEIVLSYGYHGWHDWWAAKVGYKGIPQCYSDLIRDFPFNDFSALEKLVEQFEGKIAAIILTPAEYGIEPRDGFLQKIRNLCDEKGIVMIFDEIITGFRWAPGGAQEKYGVTPDLTALAKGIADGMPVAALVGKKEIMAALKDTLVTSTFASEALSIEAALETIKIIEEEKVIERLYEITEKLQSGLREISDLHGVAIELFDPTPGFKFEFQVDEEKKEQFAAEFMKFSAASGILLRKYGAELIICPIAATSDSDISKTLEVFDGAVGAAKTKI